MRSMRRLWYNKTTREAYADGETEAPSPACPFCSFPGPTRFSPCSGGDLPLHFLNVGGMLVFNSLCIARISNNFSKIELIGLTLHPLSNCNFNLSVAQLKTSGVTGSLFITHIQSINKMRIQLLLTSCTAILH